MKLCFYACRFFCLYIGYREVMHGAVLTCLVPLDSPRSQTATVKNAQLAATEAREEKLAWMFW